MESFEYRTVFTEAKGFAGGKVNQESMERELNELGSQGWELVSSVSVGQNYGNTRWIISIFKRKL